MTAGVIDRVGTTTPLKTATTGNLTATLPTGWAADDMGICTCVTHRAGGAGSALDPTTVGIAGWNLIDNRVLGSGVAGVDVGVVRFTSWWRILVGGDAAPTVSSTGTGVGKIAQTSVFRKDAGDVWNPPVYCGSIADTTADTAHVGGFIPAPGPAVGDAILVVSSTNTDVALSSSSLSLTGGGGTVTDEGNLLTTNGDDMTAWLKSALVTSIPVTLLDNIATLGGAAQSHSMGILISLFRLGNYAGWDGPA